MPPNRLRQSGQAWQDASEPGSRGPAEQGRSIVNRACGWAAPQRHRPVRRPQVPQLLALLSAATALGLAACGSTVQTLPRPITTSSPTVSASASPTLDATDAAIIAAYDSYWSAVNQANAATSGTGAWNVPALSRAMVNPLLGQWQDELMQQEAQGIFVQGSLTAQRPRVISNTATTAEVSDCVSDDALEYYKATDGGTATLVPSQPDLPSGGDDGVTIAFTLVSGSWMASSSVSLEYGNCTGY